jgi:ketosteroid isomerase-like protein/GNAT superfamily N-acetyltransferase
MRYRGRGCYVSPADLEASKIKQLAALINQVYDDAEAGMWKRSGTRTNPGEVEHLLSNQALILAELDGRLVGAVNINLMDDGIGEFGMLVADRKHRGKGIGSALVERAENRARDLGCHTMRLELLTPRNWIHPSKQFLKQWYSRIGYQPQATEPFEILHPELIPELATECDFTIWHKSLNRSSSAMNEQANTRLVQQAYQRIHAGDVRSFLTLLADDVEWKVPAMASVPFAGTWQGRQHVGEFFRKVAETQEQVEYAPEHFIAQDDKVVVLGHFVNRVKATRKESRSEWAQVWTVNAGVITHMQEYVDTAAVSRAHTR